MSEADKHEPMTTYQFEIDDEKWDDWKDTVPRSKSLEERIIELIEADTDGRVQEPSEDDIAESGLSSPRTAAESTPMIDEKTPGSSQEDENLREQLRDELAGSGDLLEARVDEVLKMYDYLREHGTAEKDDLLDVVDVEATDYKDADSVWSNMVKGKDTLRTLPGVTKPSSGRSEWTYTE